MSHDVVIVGGGPGGLSAALTLGRGRRRVLLCDAGPPRNARAIEVHNFVTRDGTPPSEFRRIARQQLEPYRNVEVRDARVDEIRGERGAFEVRLGEERLRARRLLLCTGMIDEMPDLDGFRELWGKSIFQCPYCHGWEVQDQRFGYLATNAEMLSFPLLLRAWSADLVVFTGGKIAVPHELAARFAGAGVRLEDRPIARLVAKDDHLERVELAGGDTIPRDVLFAHPHQRQVDLVRSLGLALDDAGYVRVDELNRETSLPGVHAGGDLVTPVQAAVLAAASAVHAAAAINRALAMEPASSRD